MKLTYEISKAVNYLILKVKGEYAIEDFLEIIKRIPGECQRLNTFNVLADLRGITLHSFIPFMDRIRMGKTTARFLGPKIKIAALSLPEFIHQDKVGELTARIRSAELKVFSDEKEAVDWLLEKVAVGKVVSDDV